MKMMILMSLTLALTAGARATTVSIGPSDCSAAAVNSAISASSTHDGDIVVLTCKGSITWTATVTIPSTKGITLQVQGATNTPKTLASFPLIVSSNQSPALLVSIGPNNSPSRVSGFRFAPNSGTPDPFFEVTGQGNGAAGTGGFRLDNNYFDTISGNRMLAIWSKGGNLFGLIDNNTFHNTYRGDDTSYGPYNIQVWNYWKPSSPSNQCWGCDGWTNNDFVYGSEKFVFIEDNLFEQTANAPAHMRHYISSELGGRYVSRYNTFINNFPDTNADLHDAHGLCIVSSNGAGSRGGEIYNNTIQGKGYDRSVVIRGGSWIIHDNVVTIGSGNAIEFDEYRAETSSSCDANNALALMPPWPVPAGANWSANAPWIPFVASSTSYPLPQQVFNTYIWNNTTPTGTLINPAVPTGTLEQTYIQNNRDYFAAATKPSEISTYTPYTYPHPLRSGVVSSLPAPPTGLSALVN